MPAFVVLCVTKAFLGFGHVSNPQPPLLPPLGRPWTEEALKIVFEELGLFPSKVQERSAAKESFEASPPEFKRVVGQVAARTMQALYNEWRGKRRRGAGEG